MRREAGMATGCGIRFAALAACGILTGTCLAGMRVVATEAGADATGATDATAAIQRCLDTVAQAGDRKSVV